MCPILDKTLVTVGRLLKGRPVSQGGKDHTSHRLVDLGMPEKQTLWMLRGLAAAVDELGVARGARSDGGPGAGGLPGGMSSGPDPRTLASNRGEESAPKQPVHVPDEPGRSDPCPCGSGKKYKKCHGR